MIKTTTQERTGSPFFELLADADEIKIREICEENRQTIVSSAEEAIGEGPSQRTFFVQIKGKSPLLFPAVLGDEASPLINRHYLLRGARLLIEDTDYILARNIYSYLLQQDLRDTEALKGLGICLARLREHTSAKKCFRALFEMTGEQECLLRLGECLAAEGDDTGALEYFRRVGRPTELPLTEQFDLYRGIGNCCTRQGNFTAAWEAYQKALGSQPSSDTIHANLGTLEFQRNQNDLALSYFSKALELNPRNARAHCGLGLVAAAEGDLNAAERELLISLDLDSQNQIALLQLVNLAHRTGVFGSARERLEKFLSLEATNLDVRYALAVLLYKQGDWLRCEKEIDALLSVAPDLSKARILREELNRNKPSPA